MEEEIEQLNQKESTVSKDESFNILPFLITFILGIMLGVSLIIAYQRYLSEPILTIPSEISINAGSKNIEIPIRNDDSRENITGIKIEGKSDGNWMLIDEKFQLAPNETWRVKVNLTKKSTVVDIVNYISVVCYSEGYTAYSDKYPFVLSNKNFTNIKNITCYNILNSESIKENITTDIPNSDLLLRVTCNNCQERSHTIIVKNLVDGVSGFTNRSECNLRLCNAITCMDSSCKAKVNFYRIGGYNFLDFKI